MIPWMKRVAAKYYERSAAGKKKALTKKNNDKQMLYSQKGKGQWEISMSMRGDTASPLAALRRKIKRPRGQQPGAITTDPEEVDGITRSTYGKIYEGNVQEKKVGKLVEDYMTKYKEYIFKANVCEARGHQRRGRDGGDTDVEGAGWRNGPMDTS